MAFDRHQRERFDDVAEWYDRVRPGYPAVVLTELICRTRVPDEGAILEIGCGTGQLTKSLAERGYRITAIELGQNLSQRAARNLSPFPSATVVHADFETWDPEGAQFDVVCSAQAFHWIDPEIGYTKTHRLLRPGGSLALLWNLYPRQDGPMRRALDGIYRERAPVLAARRTVDSLGARIRRTLSQIAASGFFSRPTLFTHPWTATYTTETYEMLLRTFSDHASLPAATREHLLQGIRELIDASGGTIDRPQVSVLFVAHSLLSESASLTENENGSDHSFHY